MVEAGGEAGAAEPEPVDPYEEMAKERMRREAEVFEEGQAGISRYERLSGPAWNRRAAERRGRRGR